jgi:hypothetical protein
MNFIASNQDQELTVYHYDENTKAFAFKNTMTIEANTGLPANSTAVAPPPIEPGTLAVFDNNQWQLLEDNRGIVYDIHTKAPSQYQALGPLPNDKTTLEPQPFEHWVNQQWIVDNQLVIADQLNKVDADVQAFLRNEDATVLVDGYEFQMDPNTRKYLLEVITLYSAIGSTPDDFEWRDINNQMHSADLNFLTSIASAREAQERAVWSKSFSDKATIRAQAL